MSITIYKATTYSNKIQEIVTTKLTHKLYSVLDYQGKEQRSDMNGHGVACFMDKEAAIEWRRAYLSKRLHDAHLAVAYAQREIEDFRAEYPDYKSPSK